MHDQIKQQRNATIGFNVLTDIFFRHALFSLKSTLNFLLLRNDTVVILKSLQPGEQTCAYIDTLLNFMPHVSPSCSHDLIFVF